MTPLKRAFLSFEIKTINKIFLHIFFCFSFKDNRRTNVILISVFENAQKNHYLPPKTAKMAFLTGNNFFLCVFKNTDQKNICVSIVFKAESKPKQEEQNFVGGFPSKTKNALFCWSKMVLFVSQVSNLYFSRLFFNVKGSSLPIFTKKY